MNNGVKNLIKRFEELTGLEVHELEGRNDDFQVQDKNGTFFRGISDLHNLATMVEVLERVTGKVEA